MGQYAKGISLGAQVGGGIMGAAGTYLQGQAQQGYYAALARQAENQAALNRAATEREIGYDLDATAQQQQLLSERGEQIYGNKKVAMSVSGMDLASGSAQDAVLNDLNAEMDDKAMLQLQAERVAFEKRRGAELEEAGLLSQAAQYRRAGKSAKRSGRLGAFATVFDTAGRVASVWNAYKDLRPASAQAAMEDNILNYQQNFTPWSK